MGALSVQERIQFPAVGLSVTRRVLRVLTKRYNDKNIQALACFCCGQIRTTISGPEVIDYSTGKLAIIDYSNGKATRRTEIDYETLESLKRLEKFCEGTLLNNCSYDLWKNAMWMKKSS
jgi:hypothetical protein